MPAQDALFSHKGAYHENGRSSLEPIQVTHYIWSIDQLFKMTHLLRWALRDGPSTSLECVLDNTKVLPQSAVFTARYDYITV